jgi:tetratricopeptide (TPR) repeat protein
VRVLLKTWHRAALLIGVAGLAAALLGWRSARDPQTNFLPSDERAEWILFPAAVEARARNITSVDTIFRRTLTLDNQPRAAELIMRAAKRAELRINGSPINIRANHNWKDTSTGDVLGFLRAGTNTIEARVFNDNAPPCLWLRLNVDQQTLRSDQTWEASLTASPWHRAALASTPRIPGAGNAIAGGERTFSALRTIWPIWLGLGGFALVICTAGHWWLRRFRTPEFDLSRRQSVALLLITVALWVMLFWNNAVRLPYRTGFDSQAHINYIKYIQDHRALPPPREGWETYQPPLYYVLSAVALSSCGLSVTDASGILVLRSFTMLFGIGHFTLVFLTLRLFFPTQPGRQLVGLGLASFLPMQLYMSHFVTNETLAATLVAATVYLAVRLLQTENPSVSQYVWLGLSMGAAMLTKATGVLLLPLLFLAMAIKLALQRLPLTIRLRNLGVTLGICFAVCGWHYIRTGLQSGTPFFGMAGSFAWWQDPGFHTAADYIRFGRSLVSPLFSSFAGFADGIYSTFWGDALCSGVADLDARTPWNYELMVSGYLLALLPTLMIVIGGIVAMCRFVSKPSLDWFILLGLAGAVVLALLLMTLDVASYAQIKAFYGLSALGPFCCFGAIGWDVLTRGRKALQLALATLLFVWASNSFASFWIRPSALQHIYAGQKLVSAHKADAAASEAVKAVNSNPSNATARRFLASVFDTLDRPTEALEQAERAIELNPTDSMSHLQLAITLANQGQTERAINEGRRALELGPENAFAYNFLLASLLKSHREEEAITVAGDALTVSPFSADFHYMLGLVTAEKQDFLAAATHFAYALSLRPNWTDASLNLWRVLLSLTNSPGGSRRLQEAAQSAPDSPSMLNDLAWLLATHPDAALRNGQEAVRAAERACAMTKRKSPRLLDTLAAAYAETGRFPDAISTAQEAMSLAQSSGDANAAGLSQNLLISFQANRPYHEYPVSP